MMHPLMDLLIKTVAAHEIIYGYKPTGIRVHPRFRWALQAEVGPNLLLLPGQAEKLWGLPVTIDAGTPGGLFILTDEPTAPPPTGAG